MVIRVGQPEEKETPSLMTYNEITGYMKETKEKYDSLPTSELEGIVQTNENRSFFGKFFDPKSAIIDYWIAKGIIEERKRASA